MLEDSFGESNSYSYGGQEWASMRTVWGQCWCVWEENVGGSVGNVCGSADFPLPPCDNIVLTPSSSTSCSTPHTSSSSSLPTRQLPHGALSLSLSVAHQLDYQTHQSNWLSMRLVALDISRFFFFLYALLRSSHHLLSDMSVGPFGITMRERVTYNLAPPCNVYVGAADNSCTYWGEQVLYCTPCTRVSKWSLSRLNRYYSTLV